MRQVVPVPARADDADLWDDVVRRTPGGTAYHLWDFLDLQRSLLGIEVERFLLQDGGRTVGLMPFVRPLTYSPVAPWLPFPFLGPVVEERDLGAAFRLHRRRQLRSGQFTQRIDLGVDLSAAAERHARPPSLTPLPGGTVTVDLSHADAERLDEGMGQYRRRAVRRAIRDGVSARAALPGEAAALLGRVLQQSYGRHGAPSPYPDDVGAHVERWAEGRDDVHLGVAEVEGRAIGVLVTLTALPVALAWVGAVLEEARGTNAESVLLRAGMIHALGRGCTTWDFSGRVDDGVETFKRSFGGVARPTVTLKSHVGPFAALAAARSLGRRRPVEDEPVPSAPSAVLQA